MKRITTKISVIILIAVLSSCNKPNPIELERDNADDAYSLEIIATDPSQFDYQNGYDSTGVASPLPRASSEFIITLNKNSGGMNQSHGNRFGIATAVFYDKSKPIYNQNNRLVGYLTKDLGDVKFNNFPAFKRQLHVRLRQGNSFVDSLAGIRYHLPLRPMMNLGENINISLSSNNNILFQSTINIPEEITGQVEKIVDQSNNLRGINLTWNGNNSGKIEIIIGGFIPQNLSPLPLLRIKVDDDGKFILPKNIIDQVPYQNFESLVFSFIRRIEKSEQSNSLSDNYIAAQSIHNIKFSINN